MVRNRAFAENATTRGGASLYRDLPLDAGDGSLVLKKLLLYQTAGFVLSISTLLGVNHSQGHDPGKTPDSLPRGDDDALEARAETFGTRLDVGVSVSAEYEDLSGAEAIL